MVGASLEVCPVSTGTDQFAPLVEELTMTLL
jgi:hypothetical protein